MVWVTFRNGKAVRYNQAESWHFDANNTCVSLTDAHRKYIFATIPLDCVERIEFNRPCVIARDHKRRDMLPIAR
jgi:hypothetical protein